MTAKLTILKRLLFLLAVMSFLPACYADTGYYRAGYYAPAYRRPYYREGYYRAAPPRTVVVVPRGHDHWDRHYYRGPAARPRDYHHRHHDDRRRRY